MVLGVVLTGLRDFNSIACAFKSLVVWVDWDWSIRGEGEDLKIWVLAGLLKTRVAL